MLKVYLFEYMYQTKLLYKNMFDEMIKVTK